MFLQREGSDSLQKTSSMLCIIRTLFESSLAQVGSCQLYLPRLTDIMQFVASRLGHQRRAVYWCSLAEYLVVLWHSPLQPSATLRCSCVYISHNILLAPPRVVWRSQTPFIRTCQLCVHSAHSMFLERLPLVLHRLLLLAIQWRCLSCPLNFKSCVAVIGTCMYICNPYM